MASSHSSASGTSSLKIRSSCQACAASKLRCTKEKPNCSRCANKHIRCEYGIARPGGRKPKNSRPDLETATHDLFGNLDAAYEPRPTMTRSTSWSSSGLSHRSSAHGASPDMNAITDDALHNLFDPEDIDMAAFDASLDFLRMPEAMAMDFSAVSDLFGPSDDYANAAFDSLFQSKTQPSAEPDYMDSDCFTTTPCNPRYSTSKLSVQLPQVSSRPAGACECLSMALGLLTKLNDPALSSSEEQGVQSIIARNEMHADQLCAMIKCNVCAKDGYLVAIMTLACFKMLDWYALAVKQTSRADRTSAQELLSEFFRMRWLVDRLSTKLRRQSSCEDIGGENGGEDAPLSTDTRRQLEQHMITRLRVLSSKVGDIVKQR